MSSDSSSLHSLQSGEVIESTSPEAALTTSTGPAKTASAIILLQSNTDSNYDIPKIEVDATYDQRLDAASNDPEDDNQSRSVSMHSNTAAKHTGSPSHFLVGRRRDKHTHHKEDKPKDSHHHRHKQNTGNNNATDASQTGKSPRKKRRSILDSAKSIQANATKSIKMRHSESIASLNTIKESVVSVSHKKTVKVPMKIIGIIGFILGSMVFYYNVEGWSVLDSVYFVIVTICTVGYGTPAPTTDGSRLFTIFLMFFGIFVIFASISNFIANSIQKLNSYVKKSMVKTLVQAEIVFKLRLFLSVCTIIVGLFFGALFFHYNEGWSFISAFYFAVETSTTVGYGDLEVKYPSTKIFMCFYIIFSTILVAYAINNFNNVLRGKSLLKKKEQMLLQEQTLNFIADLNNGEGVNKDEFVLAILEHIGALDRERDIDPWVKKFEQFDTAHTGILSKKQLEAFSSQQQEESKQEMEEISRPKEMQDTARTLLRKKSLRNLTDMFTMDAVFNEDDHENWQRDYFHLNFNSGFNALRRPFANNRGAAGGNSPDQQNKHYLFRSFSSFVRKESDVIGDDDSSDEDHKRDENDSDFGDESTTKFGAPTDSDFNIRSTNEGMSRKVSFVSALTMSRVNSNLSGTQQPEATRDTATHSAANSDVASNSNANSTTNSVGTARNNESYFSIHSGFDI